MFWLVCGLCSGCFVIYCCFLDCFCILLVDCVYVVGYFIVYLLYLWLGFVFMLLLDELWLVWICVCFSWMGNLLWRYRLLCCWLVWMVVVVAVRFWMCIGLIVLLWVTLFVLVVISVSCLRFVLRWRLCCCYAWVCWFGLVKLTIVSFGRFNCCLSLLFGRLVCGLFVWILCWFQFATERVSSCLVWPGWFCVLHWHYVVCLLLDLSVVWLRFVFYCL